MNCTNEAAVPVPYEYEYMVISQWYPGGTTSMLVRRDSWPNVSLLSREMWRRRQRSLLRLRSAPL
eukprot:scaffold562396_cov31-Prasinocladus_malaysianus.AAC.1